MVTTTAPLFTRADRRASQPPGGPDRQGDVRRVPRGYRHEGPGAPPRRPRGPGRGAVGARRASPGGRHARGAGAAAGGRPEAEAEVGSSASTGAGREHPVGPGSVAHPVRPGPVGGHAPRDGTGHPRRPPRAAPTVTWGRPGWHSVKRKLQIAKELSQESLR
jgi:hypothetical protein